MKNVSLTEKAIKYAQKHKGITRPEFVKLGFKGNPSKVISYYFKTKGTKMIKGVEYTNYIVR